MENKNMIGGIVSLAVVVICVAAIMMPVLSDATATTATFENDYSYYVVKNPETATITWDGTTLQIDGETVATPDADENPYGVSLLSNANGVIRYYTDNTVRKWGNMGTYSAAAVTAMNLSIADATLTGTFTISGNDINVSVDLGDEYYVLSNTNESENVLTVSNGDLYLNADTSVQSNGISSTDTGTVNGIVVFNVSGSIEDGFTVTGYNRNGGAELTNITYDDIEAHYVEVDGYIDLYKLTNVTFTTTVVDSDDNEIVTEQSYDYFAAPLEVTAEKSVHLNDGEITLLNAIPALVIVALVIAALGIAITSRRD